MSRTTGSSWSEGDDDEVGAELTSRSTTRSRHASHSVYSRLRRGDQMRMSTKTQLNFVNGTSRQPRCLANSSIAGNQWAAWESPTSATVTVPPVSP